MLQQLEQAVVALAAVPPVELPGPQALDETRALIAHLHAVQALVVSRLADVDARGLHELDDCPTTGAWVRTTTAGLDRRDVALAGRLLRLPSVAAALAAGTLSVDAARLVARAVHQVLPHLDRADGCVDGQPGEEVVRAVVVDGVASLLCQGAGGLDAEDPRVAGWRCELAEVAAAPLSQASRLEAGMVVLARDLDPVLLPSSLGLLVDAVLPVQLEQRAADAADGRALDLLRDETGWTLRGRLDLETGELLHTVLTAEAATDPDAPADTAVCAELRAAGWRTGDPLPACAAPRSAAQRRHDALSRALRTVLDSGALGTRDKVAPHVAVTISLDAWQRRPGALPARTASGAAVPVSQVQAWATDCSVTRFVLGLGRRVVESSHTARTLKPHERRIKQLETGHRCQAAGCRAGPGTRLVPHHPDAYARTGRTSLDDTVLFCERTHADVHTGRHTVLLRDGRRLGPDGWVA